MEDTLYMQKKGKQHTGTKRRRDAETKSMVVGQNYRRLGVG